MPAIARAAGFSSEAGILLANKRSFQVDRLTALTAGGGEGAEVAGQHRGCGNVGTCIGGVLTERRFLIAPKKEQLVPDDLPADGSAKLFRFSVLFVVAK